MHPQQGTTSTQVWTHRNHLRWTSQRVEIYRLVTEPRGRWSCSHPHNPRKKTLIRPHTSNSKPYTSAKKKQTLRIEIKLNPSQIRASFDRVSMEEEKREWVKTSPFFFEVFLSLFLLCEFNSLTKPKWFVYTKLHQLFATLLVCGIAFF